MFLSAQMKKQGSEYFYNFYPLKQPIMPDSMLTNSQ